MLQHITNLNCLSITAKSFFTVYSIYIALDLFLFILFYFFLPQLMLLKCILKQDIFVLIFDILLLASESFFNFWKTVTEQLGAATVIC